MERTPIISKNIKSYAYKELTLEIEFKQGRVYQYFNVPESTMQDFIKAESKGDFFKRNIIGKFMYKEVLP